LLKHMDQILTIDQGDRLALGEFTAVAPVMTGRNEDSLIRALCHHGAVKVSYRRYRHNHVVPFRLDHEFAAADRIGVERNRVNTAVSTGLSDPHFTPCPREFLFEELSDQMLEILPVHGR